MMIRHCDICDTDDDVVIVKLFKGMGYEPSAPDPLAHKWKRTYKDYDLCSVCKESVMIVADELSKQLRQELVMVNILEHPEGPGIDSQGNVYGDIPPEVAELAIRELTAAVRTPNPKKKT